MVGSSVARPRNHFYRTPEQIEISRRSVAVRSGGFIATQIEHRRDLADQLDLEAPLTIRRRVKHDTFYERPDHLQSLRSIGALQSSPQALDLLAIHLSQSGMQARCRSGCCPHDPFEFRLACFE